MISLALLIGGHGNRLGGVDKATLTRDGTTTAQAILATFTKRVDEVFVVGRDDQGTHPLTQTFPLVIDDAHAEGPLRGIATALAHARSDWVFVVACDLVDVTATELATLAAARGRARLAVAWRSPEGAEPLCALYHRVLLGTAEKLLASGERRARALLSGAHFCERPEPLGNINTPEELAQAKASLPTQ